MASSALEEDMWFAFFLRDVDGHVLLTGIFAEDHAFVRPGSAGPMKESPRLWIFHKGKGRGWKTPARSATSAPRGAQAHFAGIVSSAITNRVNQRGAARIGEQRAAQAN